MERHRYIEQVELVERKKIKDELKISIIVDEVWFLCVLFAFVSMRDQMELANEAEEE